MLSLVLRKMLVETRFRAFVIKPSLADWICRQIASPVGTGLQSGLRSLLKSASKIVASGLLDRSRDSINTELRARSMNVWMLADFAWGDPPTDALTYFERAGFIDEIYNLAVDFSVEYIKMYA